MKDTKRIFYVICSVLCLMLAGTYTVNTAVKVATASQKVGISKTSLSLALGQQKRLTVEGTQEKVTWSSSVELYGKYLSMAEGYVVFKNTAKVNALKYNDGTHKVNIYF